MKNIPKDIYLQIGEQANNAEAIDFKDLSQVSWSRERIFKNDLEYIYYPFALGALQKAKQEAYKEASDHYKNRLEGGRLQIESYYTKINSLKAEIRELKAQLSQPKKRPWWKGKSK